MNLSSLKIAFKYSGVQYLQFELDDPSRGQFEISLDYLEHLKEDLLSVKWFSP